MANVPPQVHKYPTYSRSVKSSLDNVPSTEIPEILDSDNEDVIVEGLVPPVHATVLQQTIGPRTAKQDSQPQYNVNRAICSLNIVCYRHNGTCVIEPIMTTMESRYRTPESYQKALKRKPDLIVNDSQLFTQMRQLVLKVEIRLNLHAVLVKKILVGGPTLLILFLRSKLHNKHISRR